MRTEIGEHGLGSLSDRQLYGMYRPDVWNGLPAGERQALFQETADREAQRYENGPHAQVSFETLPAGEAGYEANGRIVLNKEMALQDQLACQYGGRMVAYQPPDMGYRILETVLHEYRHAVQEGIIRGDVPAKEDVRMAFAANDTTFSLCDGKIVSQYLCGETGYALYYLQPCELDAYQSSQIRMEEILRDLCSQYGSDPAMELYARRTGEEGWRAQLGRASGLYPCPDVPGAIRQTLVDVYTGSAGQIDPQMDQIVKAEMASSAGLKISGAACRGTAEHTHLSLAAALDGSPAAAREVSSGVSQNASAWISM